MDWQTHENTSNIHVFSTVFVSLRLDVFHLPLNNPFEVEVVFCFQFGIKGETLFCIDGCENKISFFPLSKKMLLNVNVYRHTLVKNVKNGMYATKNQATNRTHTFGLQCKNSNF